MSVFLNKVQVETKESLRYVVKFCKERNLKPTLRNFLFYKKTEHSGVPESVYYFYGGTYSKYYFYNSKVFYEYYCSLQPDFQKDLVTVEELQSVQRFTLASDELQNFVKKTLQNDYVYWE